MGFSRTLFLFLAATLVAHPGLAQQEPALTDRLVTSFIASFPDAQAFGERHRLDEVESATTPDDMADPFGEAVRHLRAKGLYGEFRSVVRRHGFASPEQWAGVAERVMKAYVANAMGERNVDVNAQMQAAIKQLQSDPNIPDAQKEAIVKRMRGSAAMMSNMADASPADRAAVRPHMTRLKEILDKE